MWGTLEGVRVPLRGTRFVRWHYTKRRTPAACLHGAKHIAALRAFEHLRCCLCDLTSLSNGRASRETVPGQFYIINGKKTMDNSVIRDTDFYKRVGTRHAVSSPPDK